MFFSLIGMRGFLLLVGMILFVGSMYLFYHQDLLGKDVDSLTGRAIADDRPLVDRITQSVQKPVSIEAVVQMLPVILLFLSFVFAFASVLIPDGER